MDAAPDPRWELVNALTHGLGAVAAVAGATVLMVAASLHGDVWHVVTSAVFGATLVLLYTASTVYHAVTRPELKRKLKMVDHCAIYLLIAGTYTPFTLVGLRGGWGWSLFGVIWGLAVAGVIFKLLFIERFHRLSTALYVGMGWLVVVAAVPMARRLDATTLAWLVAGGLAYTAGTAFYHSRRPYMHAVWHLFVLAGSACHFAAVLTQILAAA